MLELDRKTFEEEVLQSKETVLVDFFGDGCVPCAALKPHVEAFAEKYAGKLKFTGLNTTAARRVAIAQGIMGLPVVAIYKDGVKIDELVKEAATAEAVEAMIQKYI